MGTKAILTASNKMLITDSNKAANDCDCFCDYQCGCCNDSDLPDFILVNFNNVDVCPTADWDECHAVGFNDSYILTVNKVDCTASVDFGDTCTPADADYFRDSYRAYATFSGADNGLGNVTIIGFVLRANTLHSTGITSKFFEGIVTDTDICSASGATVNNTEAFCGWPYDYLGENGTATITFY